MKFSIIIPLVPAHDTFLLQLFCTLKLQESFIEDIIIVRSQSDLDSKIQIIEKFEQWVVDSRLRINPKYILLEEISLAGENRNIGWKIAVSDWLCFLDADDEYAPGMLFELSRLIVKNKDANLILHDYFFEHEKRSFPNDVNISLNSNSILVSNNDLFSSTFPEGFRDLQKEGHLPGDTNLILPTFKETTYKIHHAHLTVRNAIREFVEFTDSYRREDGIFCRDVLEKLGGVYYTSQKLSIYRESRTTAKLSFILVIRKWLSEKLKLRHVIIKSNK